MVILDFKTKLDNINYKKLLTQELTNEEDIKLLNLIRYKTLKEAGSKYSKDLIRVIIGDAGEKILLDKLNAACKNYSVNDGFEFNEMEFIKNNDIDEFDIDIKVKNTNIYIDSKVLLNKVNTLKYIQPEFNVYLKEEQFIKYYNKSKDNQMYVIFIVNYTNISNIYVVSMDLLKKYVTIKNNKVFIDINRCQTPNNKTIMEITEISNCRFINFNISMFATTLQEFIDEIGIYDWERS